MPRTKKTVGLSEVRVGLLVLASIAVLIFLILNASGDINPFSRKLHLKARFIDANGLREGSEVRLAGVRVGKVDQITLLPPSDVPNAPRVEALMTINNTIDGRPAADRIRTDSTAQQGSPSLLGNEMLINITPGTALGQPVKDFAILPSSSSNTVNDFATSGTDLAQRLSKLSDEISVIVRNVKEGKGTVGHLFNDESLYNRINHIADRVDKSVDQINDIVADINNGRGTAGKLLKDEQLYNDARAAIAKFNTAAERIDNVVASAQRGEGTVGKLLTDETL